ncbi:hypothetical protein RN001_006917 [Aquatica leii]|uniref:Anaphase-promoting complex subunit 1 n=1 Tax=Aquatica leii TaxID=1421715 RepID=A0AAN7PEL5_9COLE|nr:hypothetical protein RN001_006917 [Aquatica leii]
MIAAKDPQEFIPSGRQQLLNHPGPYELYNDEHEGLSPEVLRNEFEKVSISDNKHKEWWIVRKSPWPNEQTQNLEKGKCFESDNTNYNVSENSWSWKNVDSPKLNKRLSDIQGSKKRNSNDGEQMNNSFKGHNTTNLGNNLKCQSLGVMEEELYVKDNVVIWSKGITSTGNCTQFDSSRITVCSYTSQYLIKHAQWCTFYCELPPFNNANQDFHAKVDEPQGTPMPSICIVDSHNLKVFSVDSEDFVSTLPFEVGRIWNTKFGIILERDKSLDKKHNDVGGPTVFSMVHPLDEVSPVAIAQGSVHLIEDNSISIVFTSEKPSICMMYDSHTSQHSVYTIRKVRNDEWVEMSTKLRSEPPSLHNLSSRLKNRLSMWETRSETPSPFLSRPTSVNMHTHSHQPSRSHSPMAAISRCQSPTVSPLVSSNPWLPKLSRLHNSLRVGTTNTSLPMTSTQIDIADDYHYVNPLLCFEHIWTDSFTTQDNTGPASKVFLIDDLVGRYYLCYLIPSRLQLSMVCVEMSSANSLTFGLLTSVSAKDAVAVPHLHMLAILEHSGSIVLYSGLTVVGKLHVGGVLAQHVLSPCMVRSFPQFNSPFPRRSTLLPQYSTPISGPNFDEHFLSPVLPTGSSIQTNLQIILDPYKYKTEMGRTQLNGLRDVIADRITLQYSDGTYYRITLPPIATSTLIENCLNALRQVLPRDSTVTLLTRWYAVRNAPGPVDLNVEQEWEMFTSLIYELLGYDTEQSSEMPCDSPMTPLYVAKRQRQTSLGSNADWNYLVDSKVHKLSYHSTATLLNLKASTKTSSPIKNAEIKINTNSILFSNIRVIHYTLHLLYEDFKLNVIRMEQLPLMAQFLSKLSSDLMLKNYVTYYWKDFPYYCSKYNSESSVIGIGNLKNAVKWSCMQEQPENIIEYVYLLLKNTDVTSYPYIPNVNERSKAVAQLCGIYIKKSCSNTEVLVDSFANNVFNTRPFSTPKAKQIHSENISERIALLMTEMGIASRDLDSFPIGINLLLYGALWKCREKPPVDWCPETYNLLQRPDLAAQAELVKKNKLQESAKKQLLVPNSTALPEILPAMKQVEDMDQEDGMEDIDSALLKMRFPEDHRVAEARRLLQSSKPVTIALVQRPEVADHDFIEEQEKHLYAICARTMALPVGRGMFTLRTATPVVTEPLPLPKLYLSGKAPPRGVTVELGHIDYPQNMQHWPLFHNGVANGLRISPDAHNIDSTWIIFNKPKNSAETNYEHAGFLMALGLNGHLTNLSILNTYNYLSKSNEMTSIGILLGLASAMRGTANTIITKVLSVHLEALLPPTSMELDVSQNLQVAALVGVGLAYQGTAHRHITEVLLWEIGRPPGPEMENSTDRESYSLAAGLALGLVTLQQGGRPSGLSDLNVPDTLHYYMVGGNKRVLEGSQRDKYKVPSFQIREGCNVNLDVTAPGATLALSLMYLKSGNKTLADWMSPPTTQYLLDFARPDFLMLRILSRSLIMWDDIRPDRNWIENQVPATIRPYCMVKPTSSSCDIDYEAMNQAYCNIIAGACFGIGLKYAGSANNEAFTALLHYCHMFISLTSKSIAELAGKPTIETCLNVLLLSASMVMAGTGNLQIMRIVRHLRRRVGLASSAVVTYGSHLAIHMALGLLFLGGGRYTLSNSPASIAALICAFYPKFPTHSADNRYHLQAFRHLYVLAVEPRLIIPKDVSTGRICYANLKVVYLDGSHLFLKGPCLIPDLNLLAKISIEDERYWCVEFDRGRNWDQLQKLLTSSGLIEVKQRAGCLSYVEDKFGYRTELARTLTHSKTIPWNPSPKAITSFSSNAVVRYFSDNFLTPNLNCISSENERDILKKITKATYECVIKDKEIILSNVLALLKIIQDVKNSPSTLQIWQFKLVCAQVLENGLSTHLISPEVMLSLKQELVNIIKKWEPTMQTHLTDYIQGKDLQNLPNVKEFVSYITFYDLPFNICSTLQSESFNSLEIINNVLGRTHSSETIMKLLNILNLQL